MPTLRYELHRLATRLVDDSLRHVRTAPLADILRKGSPPGRRSSSPGWRSDPAKMADLIAAMVKAPHGGAMTGEEIRTFLKLESKVLQQSVAMGVEKKLIKARGHGA